MNSAIWTEEFEPQAWCRKFIFWIERTWRNTRMLQWFFWGGFFLKRVESQWFADELPSLRWGLESKRVTFSQISLSQLGRLGGMIIGGLFRNRRNLWKKTFFLAENNTNCKSLQVKTKSEHVVDVDSINETMTLKNHPTWHYDGIERHALRQHRSFAAWTLINSSCSCQG